MRRGSKPSTGSSATGPITPSARRATADSYTAQTHEYVAIVRDRTQQFGPKDPRTLDARVRLAGLYGIQGGEAECIRMCREVIADSKKVGVTHPAVLEARNLLGRYLHETGQHKEAEEVLRAQTAHSPLLRGLTQISMFLVGSAKTR